MYVGVPSDVESPNQFFYAFALHLPLRAQTIDYLTHLFQHKFVQKSARHKTFRKYLRKEKIDDQISICICFEFVFVFALVWSKIETVCYLSEGERLMIKAAAKKPPNK